MTATPIEIARRALANHLANLPPAELLARYAANRDADAFVGLVHQFGPCVLGVCRRVLGSTSDADDAFQAVFLALARQAGSFRDAATLPAWLHRVALRVSRKALARRQHIAAVPDTIADPADPFADVAWKDMRRVLDEELDALPGKLRGPVLLCWLDGLTQDEAASRLGLSLSTLKRRLGAGRERLRARLLRRGVAPVLAASAVLGPTALRADVPVSLASTVARAAAAVAPVATSLPRLVAMIALAAVAAGGLAMVSARTAPQPEAAPQARPAVVRAQPEAATVPLPPGAVARFGSAQFRVPDRIYSTTLSPDGKLFAVGGKPVRVYEIATWKPVQQLTAKGDEESNGAEHLVFSADGRFLAGSNSRYAYVWDVKTWKLLHRIDGGAMWRWTQFCAFTPDGLLALSDKEKLRFFNPATGRETRTLDGGRTIVLSPDGKVFVRMLNYDRLQQGEKANLIFGDTATGKDLFTLDGFVEWGNGRSGLAFAPDGKSFALLLTGRNEIEIWDTAKQSPRQTLRPSAKLGHSWSGEHDIGFTSDGKSVFAREASGGMLRWDLATGKELPRLRVGNGTPLCGLRSLPDGKTLLTTSVQGWVRLWDVATGEERPVPGRYWYAAFALAPDGKVAAVGDRSGRVDLLDAATGNLIRSLRQKGIPVNKLVFSPDRALLAIGEAHAVTDVSKKEAAVRVLRVSDGKEFWSRQGDINNKDVWEFLPLGFAAGEGDLLILANYPKDTQVWDTGMGKELRKLDSHNSNAIPSPDGNLLATDEHGEVVLLNLATGRAWKRILVDPREKEQERVLGEALFAWSADVGSLATTLPKDNVCVLDAKTGRESSRFPVYTEDLPDGVKSFTAMLWRSGRVTIRSLGLSPDGKLLAASSVNGWYVAVWDTKTGKQLARFDHDFQVEYVAFTPDGKSVITFGSTGLGYRWDIEKLIADSKK